MAIVEKAASGAFRERLLTPELAEVVVKTFTREVQRLGRTRNEREEELRRRLDVLKVETANLSRTCPPAS